MPISYLRTLKLQANSPRRIAAPTGKLHVMGRKNATNALAVCKAIDTNRIFRRRVESLKPATIRHATATIKV
jgi:hypothetical protein